MKPLLFRVPKTESESFRVQIDDLPHFYDTLHFHPEWQITLILTSNVCSLWAITLIDLCLLMSICWVVICRMFSEMMLNIMKKNEALKASSVSIYFRKDLLGSDFYKISETAHLNELLEEASRGIRIRNLQNSDLTNKIIAISQKQNFERLMAFLDLLNDISIAPNKEFYQA